MINIIEQINSLLNNQNIGDWYFFESRRQYNRGGIDIYFTNPKTGQYFASSYDYEYLQHMSVNDIIEDTLLQIPNYNKHKNFETIKKYLEIE